MTRVAVMADRRPAVAAPLSARKLLHTKWTAVAPQHLEKHFIVTRVVQPDGPAGAHAYVVMEAVHSRRAQLIEWRGLRDRAVWRQGWV